MATLAQIKTAIDDKLANLWAHIQSREAAYFTAKGRYFQGLWTHATEPTDGTESACTISTKPTDQQETWADAGFSLPDMPMRLRIDVYDGPRGKGYAATVQVKVNGSVYQRAKGQGPEDRDQSWFKITSPT